MDKQIRYLLAPARIESVCRASEYPLVCLHLPEPGCIPDRFWQLLLRVCFDEETSGLLLKQLPPLIHIPAASPGTLALASARQLIEQEIDAVRYGASVVRINLVTLILGLLLRAYLTSPTKPPGWLGALSDLKIGASLTRIHNEISRNWQLKELASEAGMSRTAFVERFKRIVGVPPLVYLISWRMQLAKDQLRASDSSLTEIATSVGYVSASAFSYAFKHVVGCLPASYRSGERMCWQQH